jgi:Holliday junction resolvase RusA-like endonuclease
MGVRWHFTALGQPPSVNHMYVRVRGEWDKVAKAPGVEQYQTDLMLVCRSARPSGWHADGQVRILLRFHLGRDADCDNLLKVILDAIAHALEMNDRAFLPCVIEKTIGNKDPWTHIEIEAL